MPNYCRRSAGQFNALPYSILGYGMVFDSVDNEGFRVKHIALAKWLKRYPYTRAEAKTLIRKGILSCFKFRNRYYVAIRPCLGDIDPNKLKELI